MRNRRVEGLLLCVMPLVGTGGTGWRGAGWEIGHLGDWRAEYCARGGVEITRRYSAGVGEPTHSLVILSAAENLARREYAWDWIAPHGSMRRTRFFTSFSMTKVSGSSCTKDGTQGRDSGWREV